jgi:hypothetical protein
VNWTPLFAEITDSSIWEKPDHVRLAWVALMARKDYRTHTVRTNQFRLAKLARITVEQAADALKILTSPDLETLTQAYEGRRLVQDEKDPEVYLFTSGEKYANLIKKESRRESARLGMQELREKQKDSGKGGSSNPPRVVALPEPPASLRTPQFLLAWESWQAHRKELKKPLTPTSTQQQLEKLAEMGPDRAVSTLRNSIANGWQGIFEEKSMPAQPRRNRGPNI